MSNTQIDLLLVSRTGMAIVELKHYSGVVEGTETGNWVVTNNNNKISMRKNVFKQLKKQKEALVNRVKDLDINNPKFCKNYFKIQAWVYFQKIEHYDIYSINSKHHKWFDVIDRDSLIEKIHFLNAGYELNDHEIQALMKCLNATKVNNITELLDIKETKYTKSINQEKFHGFSPINYFFNAQKMRTNVADQAIRDEDYIKALKIYTSQLDKDQSNQNLWVKVAETLVKMKKFDKALNVMKEASQKFSNNLHLLAYYIAFEVKFGDKVLANKVADFLLSKNPTEINDLLAIGYVKSKLGDHKTALKIFDLVISFNPKNWKAYLNRGFVYSLEGEDQKAFNDFKMCSKINPENNEPKLLTAYLFAKNNRLEEALRLINDLIEDDDDNENIWILKTKCLIKLKKFEEALEAVNETIKLSPFNEEILSLKEQILVSL